MIIIIKMTITVNFNVYTQFLFIKLDNQRFAILLKLSNS